MRCIRIRCIARICHDGVGGDDCHDPSLFTVNTVKDGNSVLGEDIANAPSLRLHLANTLPENQVFASVERRTFCVARHTAMVFVKAIREEDTAQSAFTKRSRQPRLSQLDSTVPKVSDLRPWRLPLADLCPTLTGS